MNYRKMIAASILFYNFTTLTTLKVAQPPNITAESTPAMVGFMTKTNALASTQIEVIQQR